MTVDDVADELRVSRNMVYRLFKSGTIPGAFRIGSGHGNWRIEHAKLDQWVAKQMNKEKATVTRDRLDFTFVRGQKDFAR